ncbi:MAG: Fe-S protein assembly co-chaperone HscB [Gammaproteobacteria bacterium]|nr:Fe-S protein assembly co-chaperone HscB [Gammaproteobacteria bacterium]
MENDILSSNFFELFDVPVSYEIDLDLIQQRYRELQRAVHPDKFVNATAQEKRLSMQQTSWINEALNTLKQPVERASYLLKLKGVDINLESETTMDAGFLMEQIEMREALSEAGSKDNPFDELDRINNDIKHKTNTMADCFSRAYAEGQLDDAKEWIRKMQFMQKAKKEVDELLASIEDKLL